MNLLNKQKGKFIDGVISRGKNLLSLGEPTQKEVDAQLAKIRRVLDEKPEKQINLITAVKKLTLKAKANLLVIAVIALAGIAFLCLGASVVKIYIKEISRTENTATVMSVSFPSENAANKQEADRLIDEITELKKAGKYEKTFFKDIVTDGILFRIYKVRYILSSGKEIIINEGSNIPETETSKPNGF